MACAPLLPRRQAAAPFFSKQPQAAACDRCRRPCRLTVGVRGKQYLSTLRFYALPLAHPPLDEPQARSACSVRTPLPRTDVPTGLGLLVGWYGHDGDGAITGVSAYPPKKVH